jgi:hypothetical protein
MPTRLFSRLPLERILILASVALGFLHSWVGRYAMNPDGISYLDVGDSFFRHDWAVAVNAWWSPLYPWTMGLVLGMAKPSTAWEFPLVHLVNFGVFVASLFAFRFLLHSLLEFVREQHSAALPEWALTLLAYPVFLWIALEVETVYDVSPDLAVMACFCWAAGMLLRLRPGDAMTRFALLGLILGIGYWAKSILFPLGFVTLFVGYLWRRSSPGWARGMALAAMVFVCSAAPLIIWLSHQKGRFTFGDSGKVNYAWAVSPRTFTRNWQGEEAGSGIPAHATRQLLRHPPLFEFDGPVVGTYPPWTDPSYWNEGLQWHFKLKAQMEVLATTVPSEARLLIRERPELVAGVIILALLGGQLWLAALRKLWPFIVLPLVGMGLYLPLIENDRYLGGFVLLLFLALLAAVRLHPDAQKSAAYVAFAVFMMMAAGTADYTVRIVMHHLAIPGNGPSSAVPEIIAAEKLARMGAGPGTKVAVIGDGTGAYWAQLAKLRIVAEIMGMNHGPREFWGAPEEVRQQAYDLFRGAHAKLVVTTCPSCPPGIPPGWEQIQNTPYCVRRLD